MYFYEPCEKGCLREAQRLRGLLLLLASHGGGYSPSTRALIPQAVSDAYRQMTGMVSRLRPPPTLEFYDTLHGVGGMFMSDPWVIAVGVQDMHDIVTGLLRDHYDETVQSVRSAGGTNNLRSFLYLVAATRCVAHELGHALIGSGWDNPYYPDQEAGADYYAGKFDAARGRGPDLGSLFFHQIGCTGSSCSHPSPRERLSAYRDGFNEQRRAA